jgi:predicted Zn-dependent protease
MTASFVLQAPAAARAQSTGGLIRDAEIEQLLRDYANPIFKAAGVKSSSMEIFLVPNNSFNAFVADGQKMFINTGALLQAETPNEIIGVIAHETGHVAGAHLAGLRQIIKDTQVASLIASLIGFGAAVAASVATRNGEFARAGGGLLMGANVAAQQNVLSYARSEEAAADKMALKFLERSGQSASGMLKVFHRMADESQFSVRGVNPYLLSHPLPKDRIASIEAAAKASKFYNVKDSPELQHRHDLMRAKLSGFTETPQRVGTRYPASDNSLPARYARAIVAYRSGGVDRAVTLINDLIASEPNNPYFHELKGQALLERGRAKEAIEPLRRAVALQPRSGLLRILLGHALVESGNKALAGEAISNLTVGLQQDPNQSMGYRQLARAYGEKGDIGMAQLSTAQGLMFEGKVSEAKEQAHWAQAKLKVGSPAWVRADDIISFKPPPKDR